MQGMVRESYGSRPTFQAGHRELLRGFPAPVRARHRRPPRPLNGDVPQYRDLHRYSTLLGNVVETYSPLGDAERDQLRVQLQEEGDTTMEATDLTWADRIALRTLLQTTRQNIRELVQIRFGRVAPALDTQIDRADSEEALKALFRRAAVAQTEDDLVREG